MTYEDQLGALASKIRDLSDRLGVESFEVKFDRLEKALADLDKRLLALEENFVRQTSSHFSDINQVRADLLGVRETLTRMTSHGPGNPRPYSGYTYATSPSGNPRGGEAGPGEGGRAAHEGSALGSHDGPSGIPGFEAQGLDGEGSTQD